MKSSAVPVSATPFYYGWLILAATAVSELLAQGATSYAAGLFVLPLQNEFHISFAHIFDDDLDGPFPLDQQIKHSVEWIAFS